MKDAATLLALAERVSALAGPDREVDTAIMRAVFVPEPARSLGQPGATCDFPWPDSPPRYTASLEVALTLVPEGWGWTLTDQGSACVYSKEATTANVTMPSGKVVQFPGVAASANAKAAIPALALTAACLRAHAAIAGEG